MKNPNVIGIDLAKNVIQVCKVSEHGELTSNKVISPKKLKELLAKSIPSIVAMEGCSSCYYWGTAWALLATGESYKPAYLVR